MTALLDARGMVRRFTGGDGQRVTVLGGVDLTVAAGEFVAIMGASGSGKSTLMNLLGALDLPDAGRITLDGADYSGLNADALASMRNHKIGFVFQFHHLLRDFTACENVMMPLLIDGVSPAEARSRAAIALERVAMQDRLDFRVTVLSGGEQQRVALARALVHDPVVVLADEPTGNLDAPTAHQMHALLAERTRERGVAVVAVTHNRALAAQADRILSLDVNGLHPLALDGNL